MDKYMWISNLILTVLTGVYVYLTFRLTKESKLANKINSDAITKQIRLATMPHLHCNVEYKNNGVNLIIYNSCNIPASDVDVVILGIYSSQDIEIQDFIDKFVNEDEKNHEFLSDEDDLFGVYDTGYYPVFPSRKKVITCLDFPIKPQQLEIILQYRGVNGDNYLQFFWFFAEINGENFRLGAIEPTIIEPTKRVDCLHYHNSWKEYGKEPIEDFPNFDNNGFIGIWKGSICINYLINSHSPNDPEDRGEWKDL